jgi:hypothetical protein
VSRPEFLLANRVKTIIALGVVALTGCELVAGIQDIVYIGPAPSDAGGNNSTVSPGDSGGDAPQSAPSDQSAQAMADVIDAGLALSGDANANATGDGASDAGVVIAPSDAAVGADAPPVQADADTGPVSLMVPIPGPDGRPLPNGDGGPLLGELIDDIDSESMAGWIPIRSGRVGTWFTYSDGTAGGVVPVPTSPPAESVGMIVGWNGNPNNLAAHVSGNGMSLYAGMGFNLNAYNMVASTYDASAYRGFVFWGRIGGDSGTTSVRFAVPDKNTSAMGGICTAASEGGAAGCSDYFSKGITLTPSWQQFVIYYTQLQQTGFGLPKGLTGLDAAHVYSCQFQLSPGTPFDIWIDDIYFIDP